jgi:hypothetical protein
MDFSARRINNFSKTFMFEASVVSNGNTLQIKDNAVTFNGQPIALDGKPTLCFGGSAPAAKSGTWTPGNWRV